jgi:hypothetical protein
MRAQRGAPVTEELARFGIEPVDPRVAIRLQLLAIELGLAATDRSGRPCTAGRQIIEKQRKKKRINRN